MLLAATTISFSVGGFIVGLILAAIVYFVLVALLPKTPVAGHASTVAWLVALLILLVCSFDVYGGIST